MDNNNCVSFKPPQALIDYTHKRQIAVEKRWKIMDKAEQIKKEVDEYVDTYNDEDINIINKMMDKIIAIQDSYKGDY